jgi:tetratricopeptide (TPR) repeat protein
MSKDVIHRIKFVESRQFGAALDAFKKDYEKEKAHPRRNSNNYLTGISAHNIAVVYMFAGQADQALALFTEAVALKRAAFGDEHPQVATSLVEIGIQQFAQEKFQEAKDTFLEAKRIRIKAVGPKNPLVAMVLNNVACCDFQLRNSLASLVTFQEACDIQHDVLGSTARADLDLLHAAITLCNAGYMKLRLKQYEEAQAVFEQALLIQQSVLADDNNRAIRDTLSNMDFTNAFHS